VAKFDFKMKELHIIELAGKVVQENGVFRGNAGDTALSSAFQYLFKKEFPKNKITFMQCRKVFTENDVDEINKADLLVIAGGGLFLNDSTNPRTNEVFENEVSDWMWGISKELLEKIQIPIIVYSVGYNRFRNQREFKESFNETVNLLAKKSIFFSLRNSGSVESLKKYIDKKYHDKLKLNFCPTLLLNNKYEFKNNLQNKKVGFVIAGDRVDKRHENLEEFAKHIKIFVEFLKTEGYETILINHLYDTWIEKYVKFDKFIDLYGKPTEQVYKTYSEIDVVVADRGHGQMIPFACGCKIISPISHEKLNWFLRDIDLAEFGIDESDINLSKKLIEKFKKIQKLDWDKKHQLGMDKIETINSENIEIIMKLLNLKN
jgi:polysaccharide pyruvyl transferase WcaK-like protein